MYAGPIKLAPGEGASFPGPYLGHIPAAKFGTDLYVNWYASACADSADVPSGVDAPVAHVEMFVNGPSGNVFSDARDLGISENDYEWALSACNCQDGVHYVVRFHNTGNMPIWVHVHRDVG